MAFQYFDLERSLWRLFQKRVVGTNYAQMVLTYIQLIFSLKRSWVLKLINKESQIHLVFRFINFQNEPLKYFRVFSYSKWPRDRHDLPTYGVENNDKLLYIIPHIFQHDLKLEIFQEFLKVSLVGRCYMILFKNKYKIAKTCTFII